MIIPSSVTLLNNLTINNASGVALNSSPTISGTLTLTSGVLAAGGNTLIIGSTGLESGASSSSYVYGAVEKTFATGSGQSFTYPIGDIANYTPINLTSINVTTTGNLTATTTPSQEPHIASSPLTITTDLNRYWTLTASGGLVLGSSPTATFNFVPGDVGKRGHHGQFCRGKLQRQQLDGSKHHR